MTFHPILALMRLPREQSTSWGCLRRVSPKDSAGVLERKVHAFGNTI